MTYTPDEAHLAGLLDGARRLAADTSLRARRLASFQVIDYYQAILHEAAALLKLPSTADKLGELVSGVLAGLPGLSGVDHLRGLREFRNNLFHDERWQPNHRMLEAFLGAAEATRAVLKVAAEDVARRRASMSELGQRLDQAQKELRLFLATYTGKDKDTWAARAARARDLAKLPAEEIGIEGVDLLVQIRTHLAAVEAEVSLLDTIRGDYEPDHEPDDEYHEPEDEEYHYPEPEYEPPDESPFDDVDLSEVDPGDYAPTDPEHEEGPEEEREPVEDSLPEEPGDDLPDPDDEDEDDDEDER